jgi:tRNA-dihydrouridine synthase B
MISCKTLINRRRAANLRYLTKSTLEGPLSFQLSGSDAQELAEATKIATDHGANLIDLNCGCPVKKIRQKGAGSTLLTNPSQLYQLIKAMKQNTHLPVSIKIRVQGNNVEKFNQSIVDVVTDAGLDFLVVHGRDWTEKYDSPCRYDEIKFFVDNLKIPVIGNGDITDLASLNKMLATGCAGAMIARAGVGQPWLIAKLTAEINNKHFIIPSNIEISKIFLRHVQQLSDLLKNEKLAVLQARKFAKYYARQQSMLVKI